MSVDRAWRDYTTGRRRHGDRVRRGRHQLARRRRPRTSSTRCTSTAASSPMPVHRLAVHHAVRRDRCRATTSTTTARSTSWTTRRTRGSTDRNGNGYKDPEDLIATFSDGIDHDGNGYVDDISGWDFYDHQNDPATIDTAYTHANSQMRQAAAQAEQRHRRRRRLPEVHDPAGQGGRRGARPHRRPRAGVAVRGRLPARRSSCRSRPTSATRRSCAKPSTASGSAACVMVEASNDFDSTDHQGGMFWPHVLPGNGLVADTEGIPNAQARRRRSASARTTRRGERTTCSRSRRRAARRRSRRRPSVASPRCCCRTGKQARPPSTHQLAAHERRGRAGAAGHRVRHRRPVAAVAGQARLGPAVRLRPPERVEGDEGGRRRRHPAGRLDRLARLVLALRPDHDVDGAGHRPRRRAAFERLHVEAASSRRAPSRPTPRSSPPATGSGTAPFDGTLGSIDLGEAARVVLERGVRRSRRRSRSRRTSSTR